MAVASAEQFCELSFLGQLHTLLARGLIAYESYRRHDKSYLYALILKDNNERIRNLILDNCHLLPFAQQQNAIAIVTHIDVWTLLWEDLSRKLSPQLSDAFSFENKATFPRQSVDGLRNYYLHLYQHTRHGSEVSIISE